MVESVLHSSPSFRFHHHPNSSNYLTSNENHHAVVVGRTVEFGCMQECQAEKSRRQSLLIQWLQARKEGKRRGGQAKARKKRFRFRFPGCCCCFPSSSNPLFSSVIIVRERECHHKPQPRANKNLDLCWASLSRTRLASSRGRRHKGSFPPRAGGATAGGGEGGAGRRDPRMYVWLSSWLPSWWFRFLRRLLSACRSVSVCVLVIFSS